MKVLFASRYHTMRMLSTTPPTSLKSSPGRCGCAHAAVLLHSQQADMQRHVQQPSYLRWARLVPLLCCRPGGRRAPWPTSAAACLASGHISRHGLLSRLPGCCERPHVSTAVCNPVVLRLAWTDCRACRQVVTARLLRRLSIISGNHTCACRMVLPPDDRAWALRWPLTVVAVRLQRSSIFRNPALCNEFGMDH